MGVSKKSRYGEIKNNNNGTPMKIIRYNGTNDITIEFQDDYKYTVNTYYNNFKKGCINNPYDKRIHGVGYIGIGKYVTSLGNNTTPRGYEVWRDMLARCYLESQRHKHLTYVDCTVCEEWHCYQTFAEWYEENYYVVDEERMHIDKDILHKNNKIYSPNTCIFVPQRINMIFMTKHKSIDTDLPNAIYRCVKGYKANYGGKSLGVFKTSTEAIEAHDKAKRIHIKQTAEIYKTKIPSHVYQALLDW